MVEFCYGLKLLQLSVQMVTSISAKRKSRGQLFKAGFALILG